MMFLDLRLEDFVDVSPEARARSFLVDLAEATIADDVSRIVTAAGLRSMAHPGWQGTA